MWKNTIENAYEHISLHDCVVNLVEHNENSFSFTLDNGFWIMPDSKYNPYNETLRTDQSKIRFIDLDKEISAFYVLKRHYLFRKYLYTTIKQLKFETLFQKINSKEWEMEFYDQYHTSQRNLFFGSINTKKKIGALDFQLNLDCNKMEYCWNYICPDKKW